MKLRALDFLHCPACGGGLELVRTEARDERDILEGTLRCRGCGRDYPVVRGVPRMLLGRDYELREKTQKNFSFSWRQFGEIYSDTRDFLDWLEPLGPADFRGQVVLDAGCGSGQHAVHAASFGARDVVAFDLSPAVEVAFAHARALPNVHVIQADMYHLPLRPEFDLVYCIGVLQHLPDTPAAFAELARLLAPGGRFSVWVYGYEGTEFVRYVVDPMRRVTSRLPLPLVYGLSTGLAAVFFALSRGVARPLLKSAGGRSLLAALPMGRYAAHMAAFPFHYNFNSVFDQLIAPITQYFRRRDVEGWYRSAGLAETVITSRNGMSWRGTGRRMT